MMGSEFLPSVDTMEVLGVTFAASGSFVEQADIRMTKCRNSSFALSDAGMCYPGLQSNTKSYLYKTICQPTLMYAAEALPFSDTLINKLQNTQGSIMKRVVASLKDPITHNPLMHWVSPL